MTKGKTILLIVAVAGVFALAGVVTALYRSGRFASRPPVSAAQPTGAVDSIALRIEGRGARQGMRCAGCAQRVQSALLQVPHVLKAMVRLEDNRAVVEFAKNKVTLEQLQAAVSEAGFNAIPLDR